ncbi:hypothetical protein KPH14_001391 [Odynerus spinipes]|uniref:Complex I assembly factor TIMMDC1, mitochondrial n=1 Tax=Odynerus spinipes TaxID=1348599 RepID=A0AAD9VL70_9HYME|nr:hypothetical protein KPH14_001391 [Odynerus spinipes]
MTMLPFQKYDAHRKSITEPVETRMERIKKIFVISRELQRLISFTTTAGVVGMVIGGLLHTQGTIQKFIDTNQATRFYSHYDAKKQLQLAFVKQFLKGGLKFGWKTALFSAIFESVQILLTTYREKPSVLHYVAGGGIAGLLFKMSLGLSIEDLQNIKQEWALKTDALHNKQHKERMIKSIDDEFKETRLMYETNKRIQMELSMEPEKTKN